MYVSDDDALANRPVVASSANASSRTGSYAWVADTEESPRLPNSRLPHANAPAVYPRLADELSHTA